MIDYTEVRRTVELYLQTNFFTVPIVFENTRLESEDTEHITLTDTDVVSSTIGMGDTERHTEGLITIQIFTLTGTGTKQARTIATELTSLIDKLQSGISFGEYTFNSVGDLEGYQLYQHNLSVPYTYIYGQDDTNAC